VQIARELLDASAMWKKCIQAKLLGTENECTNRVTSFFLPTLYAAKTNDLVTISLILLLVFTIYSEIYPFI
jgi:hypothetical protein